MYRPPRDREQYISIYLYCRSGQSKLKPSDTLIFQPRNRELALSSSTSLEQVVSLHLSSSLVRNPPIPKNKKNPTDTHKKQKEEKRYIPSRRPPKQPPPSGFVCSLQLPNPQHHPPFPNHTRNPNFNGSYPFTHDRRYSFIVVSTVLVTLV